MHRSGRPLSAGAAALDVLAIVVFVIVGRASHHHGETAEGIASTAWPFAVGMGAGWALVALRARRRSTSLGSVTNGVIVCVATVALGMLLRVGSGQGTAAAFVVVATGFLGAVMVGGRALLGARVRRPGRVRW